MSRRPAAAAAADVVVIGSLNMDLVARTPRLPGAGETVLGTGQLLSICGGKGANQAVAAARLGADVCLVGRVGDDAFGRTLINALRAERVNTRYVRRTSDMASGCASILVDARGENCIVVSPGANARVTPADVDAAESVIRRAAVVVLQLEIPLAAVRRAVALARKHGVPAVLDPAPVPPDGLPDALYQVDVLTPNQHEAAQLVGSAPSQPNKLAMQLISRGPREVVLKLGAKGSLLVDSHGAIKRAKSFPVKAIDSTAAGDAFTGALAVAMAEGMPRDAALRFANAAGALCCTRIGAQPALPTRDEVDRVVR
jgi:ribokinase